MLLLFLYFSLLFLYFCTTFSSIGTSTKKSTDINTISSTSRAKSRGLELGYSHKHYKDDPKFCSCFLENKAQAQFVFIERFRERLFDLRTVTGEWPLRPIPAPRIQCILISFLEAICTLIQQSQNTYKGNKEV